MKRKKEIGLRKKLKEQKAITLIALVITIIVLLILVGITIASITGENGILKKATDASKNNTIGREKEAIKLASDAANIKIKTSEAESWRYQYLVETELKNSEGQDNVEVSNGGYHSYEENWDTIEIIFKKSKNIYYIKYEYENENKVIDGIYTPEEIYDIAYGNKTETITDENEKKELDEQYLNNGMKMEVSIDDTRLWGISANSMPVLLNDDNIVVDWGDGSYGKAKGNEVIHLYSSKGVYVIRLYFKNFDGYMTANKILDWGNMGIKSISFGGCENLTEIASPREDSFKELEKISFSRCSKLETIPEDLFKNVPNLKSLSWSFAYCTSLTNIPDKLFENCTNVEKFGGTFYGCTSLTNIPENLLDNCTKVTYFKGMFYGCSNLTGNAPELWTRGTNTQANAYKGNPNGEGCFGDCSKLQNYSGIPAYWKCWIASTGIN